MNWLSKRLLYVVSVLCLSSTAQTQTLAQTQAQCTAFGTWSAALLNAPVGTTVPNFQASTNTSCLRIDSSACVQFNESGLVYLDSLRIEGGLKFNDTDDRDLTAHKIIVAGGGAFVVGTSGNRFDSVANIDLTDGDACDVAGTDEFVIEDDGTGALQIRQQPIVDILDFHPMDMMSNPIEPEPNRILLVQADATLSLHGAPRDNTWTTLDATTTEGAPLVVAEADTWDQFDIVVIPSTDLDMDQTEVRQISSVSRTAGVDTITLNNGLDWIHFAGQVGTTELGFEDVMIAGEVGLLSHNVNIFSSDWSGTAEIDVECSGADMNEDGAEIKITSHMGGPPTVEIENIEVFQAGKFNTMGHYPIHFHHAGDLTGAYVRGVAVHHSSNRAIVLHGTEGVELSDNVVHEIVGHAYYLERSSNHDTKHNVLRHNLGVNVRDCNPLDLDDPEGPKSTGAGVFYWDDPRNSLTENSAASSQFAGYYYAQATSTKDTAGVTLDNWYLCADAEVNYGAALPILDTTEFVNDYANIWYTDSIYEQYGFAEAGTPVVCEGAFVGNISHSSPQGFYADEHRNTLIRLIDFVAYKHAERATRIKNRGMTEVVRLKAADNGTAVWPASHAYHMWSAPSYLLIDSHIVGDSIQNPGDPLSYTGDETTRSLRDNEESYDIFGVEVYEGRVHVTDSHFERFVGGTLDRRVAAFGRHRSFPFYMNNVDNSVQNTSFDAASQRLFFDDSDRRQSGTYEPFSSGYVGVMLQDLDGSLNPFGIATTTVANDAFIMPNAPVPLIQPTNWNAWVMEPANQRYGQFIVRWCDTAPPLECNAYGASPIPRTSNRWSQEKQGSGQFGDVAGMMVTDVTEGDVMHADHAPEGLHTLLGTNLPVGHEYTVDFLEDDAQPNPTVLDPAGGAFAVVEAMEVHYRFAPSADVVTVNLAVPGQPNIVGVLYGDDPTATVIPSSDTGSLPTATNEYHWDGANRVHLYLQPNVDWETVVILIGFGDQTAAP